MRPQDQTPLPSIHTCAKTNTPPEPPSERSDSNFMPVRQKGYRLDSCNQSTGSPMQRSANTHRSFWPSQCVFEYVFSHSKHDPTARLRMLQEACVVFRPGRARSTPSLGGALPSAGVGAGRGRSRHASRGGEGHLTSEVPKNRNVVSHRSVAVCSTTGTGIDAGASHVAGRVALPLFHEVLDSSVAIARAHSIA